MSVSTFMAVQAPAMAATGENGVPILSAATSPMVHTCNVVSGDGTWEAVVCNDLITTEIGSDYYVQGQEEVYCQQVQAPHAIGTCRETFLEDDLFTGSGNETAPATGGCASDCPTDGRATVQTAKWAYSINAALGGVCSSNVDSAYQVWGVDAYDQTQGIFPDGTLWALEGGDGANDGWNESSGHYFVCP